MKRWLLSLIPLVLTACAVVAAEAPGSPASPPDPGPQRADLPDFGPAPELTNEIWLNVENPLRLAELRGQVVLLDMWTFG